MADGLRHYPQFCTWIARAAATGGASIELKIATHTGPPKSSRTAVGRCSHTYPMGAVPARGQSRLHQDLQVHHHVPAPSAPRRSLPLAQGTGDFRQVCVAALRAYRRSVRRLPHQEPITHESSTLCCCSQWFVSSGSSHRLASWPGRQLAAASELVPVARSALSSLPAVLFVIAPSSSPFANASWVPRGGWPSASLHSQCSEFVVYGSGGSD